MNARVYKLLLLLCLRACATYIRILKMLPGSGSTTRLGVALLLLWVDLCLHVTTAEPAMPLDVVHFYKDVYAALGHGTPPADVASAFRTQFDTLNTDASYLRQLLELRRLDLELSLSHAERMAQVLEFWAPNEEADR